MPLTKTRALMAEMATAANLPGLPPSDDGGFEITIGEDTSVLIYGENDETLLVVAPVQKLPPAPGYALTAWLLSQNMINSGLEPFRIALDAGSTLVLWGRLALGDLTGERLAGLLGPLSERVKDVRDAVAEES
jgi:Tir chaperone protein (CesT) family